MVFAPDWQQLTNLERWLGINIPQLDSRSKLLDYLIILGINIPQLDSRSKLLDYLIILLVDFFHLR